MKITLLTLGLASAFFTSSFAQKLDQPINDISLNEVVTIIVKDGDMYQSFTSGISGSLTSVELALASLSDSEETLLLEIFEGTFEDGNLSASPIGSASIVAPSYLGVQEVVAATLTDAEVIKGEKYSIRLSATTDEATVYVGGSSSSSYAGGNLTYFFVTDTEGDAFFRTYVKEELPTGIFSLSKESKISLYPNPTDGQMIQLSEKLSEVQLLNSFGTQIASFETLESLDVSFLTPGNYFILSDEATLKFSVVK